MSPLLRILGLWRHQVGWLALGVGVSLAALATGVALMASAGAIVMYELLRKYRELR
jgi:hypothetical protein